MKIVLARVLRRLDLSPGTREPEAAMRRSITLSPNAGATVVLRERRAGGYHSGNGHPGASQAVRPVPAAS
jgi:hypothetical protein